MSSLLPRLGLRRWLAHKVLGWEYASVETFVAEREWRRAERRGRSVSVLVTADGNRMIAPRFERCAYDFVCDWYRTNVKGLLPDGRVQSYSDTITTNGRDPHEQHLRWHPLTPGVAGFYRGTEKT